MKIENKVGTPGSRVTLNEKKREPGERTLFSILRVNLHTLFCDAVVLEMFH